MDPKATPSSIPNVFPPPPFGLNYIAAIKPSLVFLMISTAWSGILLPLLVALFYFSTKANRRQPIFILNVLSMVLGIFMGIYTANTQIHTILSPLQPYSPSTVLFFSVIVTFSPWLVELILVVRLVAVYPFSRTPKRIWYSIFIPFILIKIGRLVNYIIFMIEYVDLVQGSGSANLLTEAQRAWDVEHPGIKIEWILQVIDNTAASVLFISKLGSGLGTAGRATASGSSHGFYVTKLKALFWIAVSNFVFPVILSIIQLVYSFQDPNFLKGTYIYIINDYVEIVGVLLATVWASTSHWTDQNSSTNYNNDAISSAPRFARNFRTGVKSFGDSDTFNSSVRVDNINPISQIMPGDLEAQPEFELGQLEFQLEFSEAEKGPLTG